MQAPVIKFTQNDDPEKNPTEEIDKPTKLQKLKEKIKQKKLEKAKESKEPAETGSKVLEKTVKKRKRENSDVLSERFAKLREPLAENEESEDDLLVPKKKGEQTHEKEKKEIGFKVSRNQLKKIKPEGHFEGRNKIRFDEEGSKYTI